MAYGRAKVTSPQLPSSLATPDSRISLEKALCPETSFPSSLPTVALEGLSWE